MTEIKKAPTQSLITMIISGVISVLTKTEQGMFYVDRPLSVRIPILLSFWTEWSHFLVCLTILQVDLWSGLSVLWNHCAFTRRLFVGLTQFIWWLVLNGNGSSLIKSVSSDHGHVIGLAFVDSLLWLLCFMTPSHESSHVTFSVGNFLRI